MKFTNESVDDLERVFNVKLAQWQRDFLIGMPEDRKTMNPMFGRGTANRHNATMFCLVLHILLGDRNDNRPVCVMDFDPVLFNQYIKPVNDKLIAAGIKTNMEG